MRIDLQVLARERGVTILTEDVPPDVKGTAFRHGGRWYIMVNPVLSREQQNFVIAHELAEIELDACEELSLDERHHQANHRAGEILLPDDSFGKLVHTLNLEELKVQFPHCSYEVIARRTLFFKQRILTISDNGEQTTRTGSPDLRYPWHATEPEQACIADCYRERRGISRIHENLQMTAHHIDLQTGVIRVILFTDIADIFD